MILLSFKHKSCRWKRGVRSVRAATHDWGRGAALAGLTSKKQQLEG